MSQWLHGFHDRGGEHLHADRPGWTLVTEGIGDEHSSAHGADYTDLSGRGFGVIVRLNNAYGSGGTIPLPDRYLSFAATCAAWVAKSKGANIWIIGNEVNHQAERPNGVVITPEQYARCFQLCRDAIKQANSNARVIPAPLAPYHASPMNWLTYWREMLGLIATNGGCDAIAVHAYTRSANPADIISNAKMGEPLTDQFSGFRTYQDALEAVPVSLRHLPAYITEFDEYDSWVDSNTGVVQAAYAEVNRWNLLPGKQRIHALICYRWPDHDKWGIVNKPGVHADFRAAVAQGYRVPTAIGAPQEQQFMPIVGTGPSVPAQPTKREWDSRLTARGVTVLEPDTVPGQSYWQLVKAQWLDESQAGGRHHIYFDVLDQQGKRVVGKTIRIVWPSGEHRVTTEAKPGEPYAANFPMSPGRNAFSVYVEDGASDEVEGIGMGADTPGGYNAGIHTSTVLTFQRKTVAATQPTAPTPAQPVTMPKLVNPIADPAKRVISQHFGVNAANYAKFNLAGHNGLDFAVAEGTPIRAVADGVVVEVLEDTSGYGKYVKAKHAWGESLYAHLSKQNVMAGDTVKASQHVGLSGNTGNSTGPHLHLGIRINPYTRGAPFDGYSDPLPHLISTTQPSAPTPTGDLLSLIKQAAQAANIEWQLLASLAWAESSFNANAVSSAGAKGLTQLMDATWAEWANGATDPFNAKDNLHVGAAYLAWLLKQVDGNVYKALQAYVWGIGNLQSDRIPPDEVISYSTKIVHGRDLLKATGA